MPERRRFTQRDFRVIAEYVIEEYNRRKGKRKHFDRVLKEIDRQIEMRPDKRHKLDQHGNADPRKAWMPEVELPLQAESLETLMADALEMQFPDSGPWYAAHAETTDAYLKRADFEGIIAGDQNDTPSIITQDNADKLAMGVGNHWRRQYDFRGVMDLINGEAFKYSMGVGRARMVKKLVFMDTARGIVRREQAIPVLTPKSVKQTYLDDREHILMQEGFMVGPMEIFIKTMLLEDLKAQAAKGVRNMEAPNGGWRAGGFDKIEPDKNGLVTVLEAEGDLVVPRSQGNIFVPNIIVWVVAGKNDPNVVRVKRREIPYTSVIRFPYHREHIDSPYGSSPLIKGWPLQAAATEALMRTSEAAALANGPPVGYDRNDLWFAERGGPVIAPYAQWGTIGDIVVHHQIGRPAEMGQLYGIHVLQYADVVGVHRARLGAQTVSHTTAFAKNAELQRGQSRTVKYVRRTLKGPLTQFLHMEYEMGTQAMGNASVSMWLDAYKGFVEIKRQHLPDRVVFEAFGSAGPIEEQVKSEKRMAALAQAIQIDSLGMERGEPPRLDLDNVIEHTLLEGGWPDIDPLLAQGQPAPNALPPPEAVPPGLAGNGGIV